MLECVVNISEGRDLDVLAAVRETAGRALLDVHTDHHHHRSVLTLVGEEAPRAVAAEVVARVDLRDHEGAHPRFGVVDVVPFAPLGDAALHDAVVARDRFARWAADELGVPCFLYGPERALPEVRRRAFADLAPDRGPEHPHPTAGAIAVGARPVLVAYNVWLASPDLARARGAARSVRSPSVRALALTIGDRVQVSMNLIAPDEVGPAQAYDAVAEHVAVAGAELVGLVPRSVLDDIDPSRWDELDLSPDVTIESRLRSLGG